MAIIEISYVGALVAGLLSFLSPCVLPLVPPYLCFLGGVTLDQVTKENEIEAALLRRIFTSAVFFVLGFSTVFIALGATASSLGQLVADYLDLLGKIAGIIIVLLGMHFIGVFNIPYLYRDARLTANVKPGNLFGSYIIGLAFAFGWTPCVGPVLATILLVAGSETSIFYGVSLLAVYSLGLGVPFLVAALGVKPFMKFMVNFRQYFIIIERIAGYFLIVTGILFLTGTFSELSFWLLELFPALGRLG